jgi:hypothetical protein
VSCAWLPVAGQLNGLGAWNMLFAFTDALYLIGRTDEAAAFPALILEALDLGEEWIALDGCLICWTATSPGTVSRPRPAAAGHRDLQRPGHAGVRGDGDALLAGTA